MSAAVPVNSRRRDWFRILRDLMAVGVSMNQVARKCGRNGTTVKNWACGSEPKDSDARIVLALYAKHCPEKYRAHQKHFDIRLEIEAIGEPGEQRSLLGWAG